MNKFKVGDSVKIISGNCRRCIGRLGKIEEVRCYGKPYDVDICDDYYFNDADLQPSPRTIEDVQEDDVIVSPNKNYLKRVLGRVGKAVFVSQSWKPGDEEKKNAEDLVFSINELIKGNYTIFQETSQEEVLELTLDEVAEKFGRDVSKIKIKK